VILLNKDKEEINTTLTNEDGKYQFCNLAPGEYIIKVEKPAEYDSFTLKDIGDETIDSDVNMDGESDIILLESAQENNNTDAGLYKKGCLGDFVWEDSNQNGLQDEGEVGVDGVRIYLLDINGTILNQTISSNGGYYEFCGLEGEYKVRFDLSSLSQKYLITQPNVGSDESIDSDADPITGESSFVAVKAGEFYKDLDLGIYKAPSYLEIKKYTQDSSGDFKDGVSEIAVVTIGSKIIWRYDIKNLAKVTISDIKVVDDKEGEVDCPKDILEGAEEMSCFKEGIVKEERYTNSAIVTGKMPTGEEVSDSDSSEYIGVREQDDSICVGDYVWYDENLDGIQDDNEPGVIGVEVRLLSIGGELLSTTKTDDKGKYKFCNLEQNNDYIIKFIVPKSYLPTKQDIGSDLKDSDANREGEVLVQNITQTDYSFDLGIYCECDDYLVNPQDYKEVEAPSMNIYMIGVFLIGIGILFRRKEEK
ncbi:MAG: hypothetical protein GXN91_00400, partial [Epsilonproteobacteria bacterium]|nr:hypothetical protein [Campylobacterota bacterium]